MRWHHGRTRRSPNPNSEEVPRDCLTNGEGSAAHSILAGASSPTKADHICADQPATLIFRLRQGSGPYIDVAIGTAEDPERWREGHNPNSRSMPPRASLPAMKSVASGEFHKFAFRGIAPGSAMHRPFHQHSIVIVRNLRPGIRAFAPFASSALARARQNTCRCSVIFV